MDRKTKKCTTFATRTQESCLRCTSYQRKTCNNNNSAILYWLRQHSKFRSWLISGMSASYRADELRCNAHHCAAWHGILLYFIALRYIIFYCISLRCSIVFRCVAWYGILLYLIALRYNRFYCISLRCVTSYSIVFHCVALLYFVASHGMAFYCISLRCVTTDSIVFKCVALLYFVASHGMAFYCISLRCVTTDAIVFKCVALQTNA